MWICMRGNTLMTSEKAMLGAQQKCILGRDAEELTVTPANVTFLGNAALWRNAAKMKPSWMRWALLTWHCHKTKGNLDEAKTQCKAKAEATAIGRTLQAKDWQD